MRLGLLTSRNRDHPSVARVLRTVNRAGAGRTRSTEGERPFRGRPADLSAFATLRLRPHHAVSCASCIVHLRRVGCGWLIHLQGLG